MIVSRGEKPLSTLYTTSARTASLTIQDLYEIAPHVHQRDFECFDSIKEPLFTSLAQPGAAE